MPSNVINLSAELEAREDSRALTPKQELTIELRNDYNKKHDCEERWSFIRLHISIV